MTSDAALFTFDRVYHGYGPGSVTGATARNQVLKAVDLRLCAGERVALIGRSGSGKSTLARLLLGFEHPQSGEVRFNGQPLRRLGRAGMQEFRRALQCVFQDSISATNPRLPVGAIIAEPLRHLTRLSAAAREDRGAELLLEVGLSRRDAAKYPAQMSGGQLQRVAIARALAPGPQFLVLDEAVSSLDLPLQLQILTLLQQIHSRSGTGYLLITHDLRLARRFADRILVMDEGCLAEDCAASASADFTHPAACALQAALLPALPMRRLQPQISPS